MEMGGRFKRERGYREFFKLFLSREQHIPTKITAFTGYTDERRHGFAGENVRGRIIQAKKKHSRGKNWHRIGHVRRWRRRQL